MAEYHRQPGESIFDPRRSDLTTGVSVERSGRTGRPPVSNTEQLIAVGGLGVAPLVDSRIEIDTAPPMRAN